MSNNKDKFTPEQAQANKEKYRQKANDNAMAFVRLEKRIAELEQEQKKNNEFIPMEFSTKILQIKKERILK